MCHNQGKKRSSGVKRKGYEEDKEFRRKRENVEEKQMSSGVKKKH